MTFTSKEQLDQAESDFIIYGACVLVVQQDGAVKCVSYKDYWEHVKKNPPAR